MLPPLVLFAASSVVQWMVSRASALNPGVRRELHRTGQGARFKADYIKLFSVVKTAKNNAMLSPLGSPSYVLIHKIRGWRRWSKENSTVRKNNRDIQRIAFVYTTPKP